MSDENYQTNPIPAGLEYLAEIDQLLIHQKSDLFEIVFDWQIQNQYEIKNSFGQLIYRASEGK